MATIREHEPAEGLRKENREISAKMKEDEQMQKDTDAEKRTEATEAGAQPPLVDGRVAVAHHLGQEALYARFAAL